MAKMTLTIPNASAVDSSGKKLDTGLSMTTGAEAAAGRSVLKAEYYTKGKKDKTWGEKQDEKDLTFLFTLQYAEFHKQIYSPNSIEAYILIKPEDIDNKVVKAFPSKDQLNELFATQVVELKCDDVVVCDDYYVHEIIRRKYSDRMFVTLKIYSPDKVMTLQEYCRTFTAKRLGEEILKSEIGNFSIQRSTETVNGDTATSSVNITPLVCDTTGMKHIQTVSEDKDKNKVYKEHIFPYLVQYNESFYDFLARTTNRWGEFLYYENKKLCIGYDPTEKEVSMDDIDVMTYCDSNDSRPAQTGAGSYIGDAPYDSNILMSVVTEDGYDKVKATIGQVADFDSGGDVYLMRKAASVLNNSKSITNFLFDSAVDDLVAWGASASRVDAVNKKYTDAYFNDKSTDHGSLPVHDLTKDANGKVTNNGVHYGTKDVKGETKNIYNEFSEASPMVDAGTYSTILQKELTAAQNMVNIEFDTKYPDLKLGQVINVDGEKFIVVEVVGYQPETAKRDTQSYYEKGCDSKVVRYRVTAIAKDSDDMYYPTILPTGHVRTSGPQVAVVVDVDDPNRGNRVRVKYPWQLKDFIADHDKDAKDDDKINTFEKLEADHLKTIDVADATPWLLYASSSGPVKAGVHGRHYLAEKVLIDYAGGNVERPYVVGAVSADVPVAIKTGSSVMMAPNGEYIKVHEGLGKGAAAFIANLQPGLKMINSFVPFSFTPDNETSSRFEGGVEMGDKYGIWSIKASTDARNVSISSPWGDVRINAFTGITISAPNGDVRISGKNVTIAAGNNLTLTSGTNIRNKFASTYDGSKKFNVLTYTLDLGKMVAKKLAQMGMSFVDLSILRSIVEVFWRPQEGALTVKSNRFLKLEAGGASAGYPDTIYKNPRKPRQKYYIPYLNDTSVDATLNMWPVIVSLIKKVGPLVDTMVEKYKQTYAAYGQKLSLYEKACDNLKAFSNTPNDAPCATKDELKTVVWAKDKNEVTIGDLKFKGEVDHSGVDKVADGALNSFAQADKKIFSRGNKYLIRDKKTGEDAKKFIIQKRKELKDKVVEAANNVLACVIKLRNLSPDTGLVNEKMDYGQLFGSFTCYVPADYVKSLQKAFSKDSCKGAKFYEYIDDQENKDPRFGINGDYDIADFNFHKEALKRRVALNLVENLGAEASAIKEKLEGGNIVAIANDKQPEKPTKPVTDEDFESAKYTLYVKSLVFSKLIKSETGFGMSLVKELVDKIKFWTPVEEYYSWGNAKNGQILFGTGKNFVLNGSGQIEGFSSKYSRGKLNRNDLMDADRVKYDKMVEEVRKELLDITVAANNAVNAPQPVVNPIQENEFEVNNQGLDGVNIIENYIQEGNNQV